jgi:uncharacterized protein YjbI with pentapeptide repeats
MIAAKPVAPKIPKILDMWDGEHDEIIEIDRALVADADFVGATHLNVDTAQLNRVVLTGISWREFVWADAAAERLEAGGIQTYKANLLRTVLADCRITGAEFAQAHFEDCTFRNVKFDDSGFRFAVFNRVRFENCMLRQVDFGSAKLTNVAFSGCDFTGTSFMGTSCKNVDITNQDLSGSKAVLGLKGATISTMQLLQLAPILAAELGFHVKDALHEV